MIYFFLNYFVIIDKNAFVYNFNNHFLFVEKFTSENDEKNILLQNMLMYVKK